MKVYASPVPFADPDFRNYDLAREEAREAEHKKQVEAWLRKNGYDSKHTGRVVSWPVGDGAAQYMVADGKRGTALIHLPYGDRYQFSYAHRLTRADVLEQADREDALAAAFEKARVNG